MPNVDINIFKTRMFFILFFFKLTVFMNSVNMPMRQLQAHDVSVNSSFMTPACALIGEL